MSYENLNKLISELPHRPPMLMIDEVTIVEERKAVTKNKIKLNNPFIHKDNTLSETAYIELMAQTCAIFLVANREKKDDEKAQLGFLIGISNFEINSGLMANDEVIVSSTIVNGIDNYFIFKCSIENDNKNIAIGDIKIYAQE
jgi:predicted hotdog family 3-hydroxylacyl-ACP dehydratase